MTSESTLTKAAIWLGNVLLKVRNFSQSVIPVAGSYAATLANSH